MSSWRHRPCRPIVAAALAGALSLAGVASGNEDVGRAAEGRLLAPERTFSFSPRPHEKCLYFMVTEAGVGVTSLPRETIAPSEGDREAALLFTDAIGLMRNLDKRQALGASVDVHLLRDNVKFAPTLRYKRWLSSRQSFDLSLGYVPSTSPGLTGPLIGARYSPAQWFYVQGGAGIYRHRWYTYEVVFMEHHEDRPFVHGGIGFGGVPGVVVWGAQAIGAAIVVAWIIRYMD